MGDSNGDEDGDGVDGDGSEGNSPSRQGAGTELLSLETWFRWQRRGGTLSWKMSIVLGFLLRGEYIG